MKNSSSHIPNLDFQNWGKQKQTENRVSQSHHLTCTRAFHFAKMTFYCQSCLWRLRDTILILPGEQSTI